MLPREVPDFPNLPAILRWEISLALVVLAWSLLSLGRYERLKRRWNRRPRATPVKVIHLPRATVRWSLPPARSRWAMGRRGHRLKVLGAAAGFATVAASVAYAMPNIVHLDRPEEVARSGPRLEPPAPPPTAKPPRAPDRAASEKAPAMQGPRTSVPVRGPSVADELTVSAEAPAVTSPATQTPDSPVSPVVHPHAPSPEPSADPSPTPEGAPSPTPEGAPSPTPEGAPSPTSSVSPSAAPSPQASEAPTPMLTP
jgi:hypothetical protein